MMEPSVFTWCNRRPRILILAAGCVGLLGSIGLLTLLTGTPNLSLPDLWVILTGGGKPLARIVVTQLRLPRLVLGSLAGAMLALSGGLLQDALQNALAGPELLGVSAGATVVVAAITILHLAVTFSLVPWLALAGALIGSSIVILTMHQVRNSVRLVLTGAALTALLNACVIVFISLGSQNDISVLFLFLVGSLANRTWMHVSLVLPWAAPGIPLALLCARPLNVLQLGDDVARGLGMPVMRVRLLILALSSALVSVVVAVCGPISFIALLAPHLARRILKTSDARAVLPCAALIGAVLLSGADLFARQVFAPQELPVGIWTTLIGGPCLLLLLRRKPETQRGEQ
ncbi:MAG TPA: iron ABC transporter permease [Ktedonobacteraceae bacterium]|nr:iron ABC transporter permease [Ktedonobacteraceae bacterium]